MERRGRLLARIGICPVNQVTLDYVFPQDEEKKNGTKIPFFPPAHLFDLLLESRFPHIQASPVTGFKSTPFSHHDLN